MPKACVSSIPKISDFEGISGRPEAVAAIALNGIRESGLSRDRSVWNALASEAVLDEPSVARCEMV